MRNIRDRWMRENMAAMAYTCHVQSPLSSENVYFTCSVLVPRAAFFPPRHVIKIRTCHEACDGLSLYTRLAALTTNEHITAILRGTKVVSCYAVKRDATDLAQHSKVIFICK
jgi:hypothetical protein